jgi:hypothetical protein
MYLTMLVIIFWALDLSQGHLQGSGSWGGGEVRPILGPFKCSWLDLEASFAGSCGVRSGGLGVSMRIMEPEEGGVVAVSRNPWPGLLGAFAAGASLSCALSLLRVEAKRWKTVAKVGIVAHKGVSFPQKWVSMDFYIFPCTWKLLPPWLP